MMNDPDSGPDLLNDLANDFAERFRRGERPGLTEYTDKYPELAAEIRDLFPAMGVIEELGSVATGPHGPCATSATSDGAAPRQLGEYRILREVARGGMGIVYEAVQESLGRHVALKVLPFQSLGDALQLERFQREARAAAMLHHTNIVPVFGVGEHEGVHFFAMQFIRGQALDSVLQELSCRRRAEADHPGDFADGPGQIGGGKGNPDLTVTLAGGLMTGRFPGDVGEGEALDAPEEGQPSPTVRSGVKPDGSGGSTTEVFGARSGWDSRSDMPYFRSVARVGLQVAEALAYAHGQGVLHRDVKPSNLLLDTEGTAWVTDFGLAKADGSGDLTSPGDLLGTLRYMAPERFRGVSDARSDVFSLGLTLYEMATLRPAFAAPERAQLIERMLHDEPPPPRTIDRRIPRDLETLILKAIAKEPARRYQTAGELAADLQRFLADRPVQARRSRWPEQFARWCRRNPVVSSLLLLLVALLVGGTAISTIAAIRMRELAIKERDARSSAASALVREKAASGRVTEKADELEWQLYVSHVGQAQTEWQANHIADAERLLNECPRPLRGWEWAYAKRLCHLDLWTYRGHGQNVWSVAISPDGTRVASGAGPRPWAYEAGRGELAVCDAATGKEVFARRGLKGGVHGVTFSPDGTRIATVTGLRNPAFEGELTIWDATTGRPVFSRTVAGTNLLCVAFSPDGTRVAAGCGVFSAFEDLSRPSCKVWDAQSGQELRTLAGRAGGVDAIAFHPDGHRIAVASSRSVDLYDLDEGRIERTFAGHASYVYAIAFSPDGRRLATGGFSTMTRLWDVATGAVLLSLPVESVHGLMFRSDGARLVTASEDQVVRLWDTTTGAELSSYRGHQAMSTSIAISADGTRIASGSQDATVKLWDARVGQPVVYRRESPSSAYQWIMGVALSPDGRRAITASRDNTVSIWDAATGQVIRTLEGPPGGNWEDVFWCVAVSPDGRQVAAGHSRGRLLRWDVETGRELPTLQEGWGEVTGVDFSPDGTRIATAGKDQMIRLWDAVSGRLILSIPAHPGLNRCTSVAFSPDGTRLASGAGDYVWVEAAIGELAIWDASTGREIFVRRFPNTPVRGVAFSPDGSQIAVANHNGTVLFCDAADGHEIRMIQTNAGGAMAVGFISDGTRLVSAGSVSTKLWDTRTGREVTTLRGEASLCLGLTRDGRRLITGGYNGEAQLWDATPLGAESSPAEIPAPVAEDKPSDRSTTERLGNDEIEERRWRADRHRATAAVFLNSREPHVANSASALVHAEQAVGLDPGNGSNWNTLASAYFANGQGTKAEQTYERARAFFQGRAAEHPDVTAYLHELGRVDNGLGGFLMRSGRLRESEQVHRRAQSIYEKLASASPDPLQARLARQELMGTHASLASLFMLGRRPAEAVKAFRVAIALAEKLDTDFPDQHYSVGLAQQVNKHAWLLATSPDLAIRDPGTAVELAKKVVELVPTAPENWNTLGVARYRAGDWRGAIEALSKSEGLAPGKHFGHNAFFLAMSRWHLGEETEARGWHDLAAGWMEREAPRDEELIGFRAESRSLIGLARGTEVEDHPADSLLRQGRYAEAESLYREALAFRHRVLGPENRDTYEAMGKLFTVLEAQGQITRIVPEFARAVDDRPDDPGLRHRFAFVLAVSGDHDGYRRACAAALTRFAASDDPLAFEVARACVTAPGGVDDFAAPLMLAKAGVARAPKAPSCLYVLGLAHYRAGQLDEAVRRLTESTQADPNWGATALNWPVLAMAQWRLGHDAEARQWLEKCRPAAGDPARRVPPGEAIAPSQYWWDRAEFQLLRHEAEALILDSTFPADPFAR